MPTAAFTTLGCKVNQYETQRILESFEAAGFEVTPFDGPADVYVINSCSVTSIAESKSRYAIRRAKRINPNAKVVVTGCAGQMAINKGECVDGADLVVPNPEKLETLNRVIEHFEEYRGIDRRPVEPEQRLSIASGRTRATLKIQDGCSVMCSYCSIPYTRPVMSSRSAVEVLQEAQKMVDMGYKELILTGVLIGAYGAETGSGGPNFEDLVEMLSKLEGDYRIRISSIEMRQLTPRLIELIRRGAVVPHLHIPLQSGDSGVLEDMNRPYTQADYLQLCSDLYNQVPEMSITTDILVGFPTESIERFESSMLVCETAKFLKAHVFRFSPRFGTPADTWGDPVSNDEKIRRSAVLSDITRRTASIHSRKFLGRTMRVLVEGKESRDGLLCGLTDNYLELAFPGPSTLKRNFASVRIVEQSDGVLYGELTSDSQLGSREISISAK